MRMVVVIGQLSALLDELMVRETYKVRLTPEDALVIAWIVEQSGISCARIAERVGRKRQSVQRTLERLRGRGLVEGYESDVRKRNSGWGLTAKGYEMWEELSRGFQAQDDRLRHNGADPRQWANSLEELMRVVHGITRRQTTWGLPLVVPPEEEEISDWDH
jgi:DNA-binding MarR family transcriptional regulator